MQTAFSLSIDAHPKFGVTTGISAYDRAKTIEVAIAPDAIANDLVRPGHMFPCVARKGGVLKRCGHTEAVVDLATLCGHRPAGVMCEIMSENGEMARRDELSQFAKKHGFKFITVSDLIAYRLKQERFVQREVETFLPTQFGDFNIVGYRDMISGCEHVALVKDDGSNKTPIIQQERQCYHRYDDKALS